jgi:predicted nucleic acid-binding protein
MILLDTTVLVDCLRTPSQKLRGVSRREEIAISGVTREEVLHGAKNAQDFQRLLYALDRFHQVPIDGDTWNRLGRNLYSLRGQGIAVPFPDALIATVAIQQGLEIWTRDAHFARIQTAIPDLRLFREPV